MQSCCNVINDMMMVLIIIHKCIEFLNEMPWFKERSENSIHFDLSILFVEIWMWDRNFLELFLAANFDCYLSVYFRVKLFTSVFFRNYSSCSKTWEASISTENPWRTGTAALPRAHEELLERGCSSKTSFWWYHESFEENQWWKVRNLFLFDPFFSFTPGKAVHVINVYWVFSLCTGVSA